MISGFRKVNNFLHLWLGLASGIVVVIVSVTGCIYVFEQEIRSLYEPWRYHAVQALPYAAPSKLLKAAKPYLKGEKANSIVYRQAGESAQVSTFDRKKGSFTSVYLNAYTAEVLKSVHGNRKTGEGDFDFFRFVLDGHRALWLPYDYGRPVVGVAVILFVIILLSGLMMWWPKNWRKSNRDKSFKIKWTASFKRVNYDLHNVLGFYSMLVLLCIALTGLVWSFEWYSKSMYWLTSGGRSLPESRQAKSDTTKLGDFKTASIDALWQKHQQETNEGMFISLPKKPADPIALTLYLRAGTFYKTNNYLYDQLSLKPLKSEGPFAGNYQDKDAADKLRRMNYDIHIGAILGIPGKLIAFMVSFISASLPITGFIIWWGKKKKSKKKSPKRKQAQLAEEKMAMATADI